MRILFVTPYPISRIRIRSYGFVSQLARKHAVTVLALCSGERDMGDMWELKSKGITIHAIQEKRIQQYIRSFRALGTDTPLQVAFGASPALKVAIKEELLTGKFDLIHVEFVRALGALPEAISVPVIWDAVDCISQLYEQGGLHGATPMMRFFGRSEAYRTRIYEQEYVRRLQHVLVTSERDRQALLQEERRSIDAVIDSEVAEISVVPHGIDRHYFQRYTGLRKHETLVFSGKMSFHANVAGVLNLVERILPHIWKQRPNVQLIIAGSAPPGIVRHLARDPRIKVTGYVPDLRPFIAQAQIAVSPLPYSVGIQNKVLEAMALGTPVVASSSANAGLQTVAGRDLLVADEPEMFAESVLRLLNDSATWKKLAEAGLEYIATHHNWDSILEQLDAVYSHAVGKTSLSEIAVV